MALEAFRGKTVFSRGFGGNSGIFEVVGRFWRKRQELLRNLRIFWGFLECLKGLGLSRNYFLKPRVLLQNLQVHRDRGLIYSKLRGFFAKFMRFIGIGIISQQ
jgi:hypothetical protein